MTPRERARAVVMGNGGEAVLLEDGARRGLICGLAELVEKAVREAITDETERCARLAEARALAIEADLPSWESYLGEKKAREKKQEAGDYRKLAEVIREGPGK